MKPRISHYESQNCWTCNGLGCSGEGKTPRDAYVAWIKEVMYMATKIADAHQCETLSVR